MGNSVAHFDNIRVDLELSLSRSKARIVKVNERP